MQSIQVRTSQNVVIDYQVGGLGDRIVAFLIDLLILISYMIMVSVLIDNIGTLSTAVQVIIFIPAMGYHLILELLLNGQSIGKKARNIRVIKLDGSRPGFGAYFLRWILSPIDFLVYGTVAILCILLTPKAQRLGDLAAGTTVIKLTNANALSSNPIDQPFSDDYQPVFREVIRLNDNEIDLIDQALAFNRNEGNSGPAKLLAEKLAEKMGVAFDEPVIKFLHTVKKDYNHITSQ